MKKKVISLLLAAALFVTLAPLQTSNAAAAETAETKNLNLVNHFSTGINIGHIVASPKSDFLLMIQFGYTDTAYLYNISSGIRAQLASDMMRSESESLCFSFDGSMCAVKTSGSMLSASASSVITIFDTKSGEAINEISIYGTESISCAFNHDNNLIVSHFIGEFSDLSSGISVRNINTGEALIEMDGRSTILRQNPSNDHLAAVNGGSIRIHNSRTGGSIRTLELGSNVTSVSSIEYSPDGKHLAASFYVSGQDLDGYSNYAATSDGSNKTALFDVGNNYAQVAEINAGGRISFIDDSDMIVVGARAYSSDDDYSSAVVLEDSGSPMDPESAFITRDGKYLVNYSYSSDGVRLLDASKISVRLEEIRLEPDVIELAVGEEKELKLIGTYSDKTEAFLNIEDGKTSIADFSIAAMTGGSKIKGLSEGKTTLKVSHSGMEISKTVSVVPQKTAETDAADTTAAPLDTAAAWAHDSINSAAAKGFVPNDLQDNYSNIITRQEFCRMAVKFVEYASGMSMDEILTVLGLSRDFNAFSDTSDPDILAAYALGITNGTGYGKFTPDGQFSREQAATMLMNVCYVLGVDELGMSGDIISTSNFTDIGEASEWAADGINFCYENGIMGGTSAVSPVFSPKDTYTRQESIVTFDRIL